MKIEIPANLEKLAKHLSAPIYVVGGFVRNSLLFSKKETTDIDICGSLTPSEISEELSNIAVVREINPRIGTVVIKYENEEYEYTTFRQDSYPIGGQHRPSEVVFVRDISSDVKRRDFTVNALYADISTGAVIDLCGGLADLEKKQLRTVREPLETFSEDGLRLLRLVRFASELGFSIEEKTANGAKQMRDQLLYISGERKREEFNKILVCDYKYKTSFKPSYAFYLMREFDFWENINIFESVWKDFTNKENEYGLIDEAPYNIRLETLAIMLCGKDNTFVIEKVFAQDGLRYPKDRVKQILTGIDFVFNIKKNEDLMFTIAQNKDYIDSLQQLSFLFKLNVDVKKTYLEMKVKGLPFSVKELNVTEKDFITLRINNKMRGIALKSLLMETYKQKRNLGVEEKRQILLQFSER